MRAKQERIKQESIKQIDDESEHTDDYIKHLQIKINDLLYEKSTLSIQLNEHKIKGQTVKGKKLKPIFDLSDKNAMKVNLFNDTRTTPIMDEFYHSDKLFLIFMNMYHLNHKRISLVVTKGQIDVNYTLTMTDLKKSRSTSLSNYVLNNKNDRMYPLFLELLNLPSEKLISGNQLQFQKPCLLGGQTFSDQTGFGSEYHGIDLVYQKEYGETTKFLIVGIIVE